MVPSGKVDLSPLALISTSSPGSTSRTNSAPTARKAHDSDDTTHASTSSANSTTSLLPSTGITFEVEEDEASDDLRLNVAELADKEDEEPREAASETF